MNGELRQCTYCGRAGTRGFTFLNGRGGGVICTATRACSRRRQREHRVLAKAAR